MAGRTGDGTKRLFACKSNATHEFPDLTGWTESVQFRINRSSPQTHTAEVLDQATQSEHAVTWHGRVYPRGPVKPS